MEDDETSDTFKFPDNFKFGFATAAYQIEGAWDADGKGPSGWDVMTHDHSDWIADGSNGDEAAKSYELYKEDVRILKKTGSQFYRFSIGWSRVLPNGDLSSRNQAGIDYYHRLMDELLDNGIEPMVTMYHWDLPQYLLDLGGLTNPLFVEYFEQYANLLYTEYGKKVKMWITFNEPEVYCGQFNAGRTPGVGQYLCAHYTILSHARAYHLYKTKYFTDQGGRVGITLNGGYSFPDDPTNATHIEASERNLQFWLGLYAHALFKGDYPKVVRESVDRNSAEEGRPWSRLPRFTDAEIEYCLGTSDFLGLNYYSSGITWPADVDDFDVPSKARDIFTRGRVDPSWPRAKSSWLFSIPEGLYELLKWMEKEYHTEVIITENGWSDDGELNDVDRIIYFEGHINAVARALKDGCNVSGYTAWSLMDNFEWFMGYTEKFGVYRVDIDDPERVRVPKKSVEYLTEIFKSRTIKLNTTVGYP